MCEATKLLEHLKKTEPVVLSDSTIEKIENMSEKDYRQVMIESGLYTADGQLAKKYQ
jgi:hypothetical protein